MRPVRLEMNGFASFRDRTVVDFTDVDYFALVGPTGSGKSTVLDAITFALYGTAFRWGRTNAIADALAPTTNRCTVSLTFDVGANRYQVAREVRRAGQAVQQRTPSLVRFPDPTALVIDPNGPPAEVLAGDLKELRLRIVELLGLEFEDFCQCVVLPQGEFARFLSAPASERQRILLKLLGAAQYEVIGKQARELAAKTDAEAKIHEERLTTLAAATPEAKQNAQGRIDALAELEQVVDRIVERIKESDAQAEKARATEVTLSEQLALLASVQAPEGVPDLQRQANAASQKADADRQASDSATDTLTQATRTAQAGPQRAVIEQAQMNHQERAALVARRGPAERAAADAQTAAETAAAELTESDTSLRRARQQRETQQAQHDRAQRRLDELLGTRRRLASVRAPDGLTELVEAVIASSKAESDAAANVDQCRQEHEKATARLADTADQRTLAQAEQELETLGHAIRGLSAVDARVQSGKVDAAEAETAEQAADTALHQARDAADHARMLAGAAQLRPTLQVGHDCPVCEQVVTALPPPLFDTTLQAALAAVDDAKKHLGEAAHERRRTTRILKEAEQEEGRLAERRRQIEARLAELLPARPAADSRDLDADLVHVHDLQKTGDRLRAEAEQAARSVRSAQEAEREAHAAVQRVAKRTDSAKAALHTTLGGLAGLTPPQVDADDLDSAWDGLTVWAADRLALLDGEVQQATSELGKADGLLTEYAAAEKEAEAGNLRARRANADAADVSTNRKHELSAIASRLDDLNALLADAPTEAEIPTLLALSTQLTQAVDQAAQTATRARSTADASAREHRDVQTRVNIANAELTAARDRVAVLSPPTVTGEDLTSAWDTLAQWARRQMVDLAAAQQQAEQEGAAATRQSQRDAAKLDDLLTDNHLEASSLGTSPGRAHRAPRAVAIALERARAGLQTINRTIAEATELRTKIDTLREQQQVAALLADLLRANRFPQWLADSALDSLVAGASESLRRLSGEQYDLTHNKGEFFVIDHADADSVRSARTLSGGETFQASLALALALSDHLAGMAGSTKLESMFLDEGFGTLDPETLEVVAGTLENLAQSERTVGVITHVAALADRAPVRFRVRRDNRSSRIERESV